VAAVSAPTAAAAGTATTAAAASVADGRRPGDARGLALWLRGAGGDAAAATARAGVIGAAALRDRGGGGVMPPTLHGGRAVASGFGGRDSQLLPLWLTDRDAALFSLHSASTAAAAAAAEL